MTSHELGRIFGERYNSAADKMKVTSIHLFGIEFANQLKGQPMKEICALAGVPVSCTTEIFKGMRLAEHVTMRPKV